MFNSILCSKLSWKRCRKVPVQTTSEKHVEGTAATDNHSEKAIHATVIEMKAETTKKTHLHLLNVAFLLAGCILKYGFILVYFYLCDR